jgi:two-component system, NarL family, nitrate/nitrite response regulator NarL
MVARSFLILARSPLKYDDVRSTNARRSVEMPSAVSVVVHPNRIFREGLVSILQKVPIKTACSAASIEEVPSTISSAGEQILVLIGVRENSDLAQALSTTKAILPDAHIVVVGDAGIRGNVRTALELGATSFVDETIETSSLVKELELVMLGAPVISVSILKQLLRSCTPACIETAATPAIDEPPPPDVQKHAEPKLQLSDREAAILNSLVLGAPNKVIAYQLNITEATVKVHVKAILRKIQVKNRTQAAIWAVNRQVLAETLGAANGALPHPSQY